MWLTVSCQKGNFFTVIRQKYRLILTVKKFPGISNLTFSADLHGILASEESFNWKNQFPWSQNTLSTCFRHYKTLQLAYI